MNLIISSKRNRVILRIMMAIVCLVVAVIVYFTGGVQYVFPHIMYVPIIVIAILLGAFDGVLIAVFGGLLLGPFMPIDVSSNTMQSPINWIIRLIFFVLIAMITSYSVKLMIKYYSYRFESSSPLTKSKIPLLPHFYEKMNSLKKDINKKTITLVNIKVINHDDLKDLLSEKIYSNILKEAYQRLTGFSDANICVYVRDMQTFLIIIINQSDISPVISQIRTLLDGHFYINDMPIHLDTVMGSALYKGNVTETLRQSIVASRYSEKQHYYHTYFKEELDESSTQLFFLGSVLDAIENDDFYLVFHPIYNMLDGKPVCLEALIRWNHKTLGQVYPNDFIPIIEKTDLINPLTEWVLKKALEAIKVLENINIDINVAINISTRNLFHEGFFGTVEKWLKFYDVKPEKIEFEITESSLMENPINAAKALEDLKNININFSIDDFGTGYSSFAYLTKFPVHRLKIDRSFISSLDHEITNQVIVDTSVFLANKLNILTIAEGVETEEQLKMICEHGCNFGQGYFWTKPLKLEDIIQYLQA